MKKKLLNCLLEVMKDKITVLTDENKQVPIRFEERIVILSTVNDVVIVETSMKTLDVNDLVYALIVMLCFTGEVNDSSPENFIVFFGKAGEIVSKLMIEKSKELNLELDLKGFDIIGSLQDLFVFDNWNVGTDTPPGFILKNIYDSIGEDLSKNIDKLVN